MRRIRKQSGNFEVEILIALRGEMDEEFARASNKQGNFFSP
jgi:hypothetical protein